MDNLRFILILALGFVLLMLWQEWEKDYGGVLAPTSQQTANGPQDTDVPVAPVLSEEQNGILSLTNNVPGVDKADEQPIKVKTDLYQISIGRIGGGIDKVELLKYPVALDKPEQPTLLLNDTQSLFYVVQGGLINKKTWLTRKETFISPSDDYILQGHENKLVVPLIWISDDGTKVKKIYEFTRDSYLIAIRYEVENQSEKIWEGSAYNELRRSDPGRESHLLLTYTGAAVSSPEKRYRKISFGDMEDESLDEDIVDGWAAMLQHYFVSAIIPASREQVNNYYTRKRGDSFVIGAVTPGISVKQSETGVLEQKLYIGPKIQSRLEKIAPSLELTVDFGLLWFLAKPLFWCLEKFYRITGNWGWAIVLVTLMLKLIFFKLSETGYKSMANMRRVQPRLMAIKDRYKGDRARLNQAMMDVYKKEKINPLGGCFPILIQIPVFIALYWVLLESVELRQTGFIFWLTDLSAPDRFFVLPLLMGVTMLIQQKLNPAPMDPVQQKVMTILPIIFTVFFAFFPSGLVLYWVVNNVLSIAQQWVITRSIDRKATSQS